MATCPRCKRKGILKVVLRVNGGMCGVCRSERLRRLAGKPVPARNFALTRKGQKERKRRDKKNENNGEGK